MWSITASMSPRWISISPAFLDGVEHHHLHQQRSDAELARRRVNHQAADLLGLGGRFRPARCRLNHAGAENIFGGPVHDVKRSCSNKKQESGMTIQGKVIPL
jgi:hypothetical protein